MFTKSAKALALGLALAVLAGTSHGAPLATPDPLGPDGSLYQSTSSLKSSKTPKAAQPWRLPCGPMIGPRCLKGHSLQCFAHNNSGCCTAARCVPN